MCCNVVYRKKGKWRKVKMNLNKILKLCVDGVIEIGFGNYLMIIICNIKNNWKILVEN